MSGGHTRGPWQFSRELNVFEVSPTSDDAPSVAFVLTEPSKDGNDKSTFEASHFAENVQNTKFPAWNEAYANASLISAAPELAEALEAALQAGAMLASLQDNPVEEWIAVAKAGRAALAKAAGQAGEVERG